ncbi:MAG: DOPA 4,5-dioxygenase [marine bacterium B5-7]|nr:MAG: DOPA 4,5-dioxygenase [marine bacterium B5-7]
MKPPQTATHPHYHAHVYFDADRVDTAIELTERASKEFDVVAGRLHRKNVGPHPAWSQQLAFKADVYESLIEWLDQNRDDLTILVHANTGNHLQDHTEHAWWLGSPAILNLEIFKQGE